jgi:pseudaminic acid synthase
VEINNRRIGRDQKVYIIAELSANHNQNFDHAVELIQAAHEAGADAIKLQTYTPDTITLKSDKEYFRIKNSIWEGRYLYDLYAEAYTPWEWHPKLKKVANDLGLDLFSTPFDHSATDFLEQMNVPAYKIASFENVDFPLLRYVASKGKPIIMSTGMATLAEIDEAVAVLQSSGAEQIALLKCTSSYPALPESMHLRTIPHMAEAFGLPIGLSDHTLGITVPVAAVSLGACIIEKHFTLSRTDGGPDSAFSLEPQEFKQMVEAVRVAEKAIGSVSYALDPQEAPSRVFRRSLFVVEDMQPGDVFTTKNVRSVRPAYGLHTRYFEEVLGRKASQLIERGTPLSWSLIS